MRTLLRHGTFPLFFLGFNGAALGLIAQQAPDWTRYALLLLAVLTMLAIERLIPWQPDWNRDQGDSLKDLLHGGINTALNYAGLWLLPLLTAYAPFPQAWPRHWPFLLQLLASLLVLDAGITLAHYASHRIHWLWRFHAVHHGLRRLYGFNGLMKHPVHQLIETGAGIAPLWLAGIPAPVAAALGFCVAIQLLLQHSNADFRIGPLKALFATAELHRHHHVCDGDGDVNFGLFTTIWDRLLGTLQAPDAVVPRETAQIGVQGEPDFPQGYLAQLRYPFSAG
jgi:sterol desaturase/sphingolipid hydroxylase (fatty acid hydroxylase superfamily)